VEIAIAIRQRLMEVDGMSVQQTSISSAPGRLTGPAFFGETEIDGSPAVVKLANPTRREYLDSMVRELAVLSSVRHPNIVEILRVGTAAIPAGRQTVEAPYIVIPRASADLEQRLRAGTIDMVASARALAEVADALKMLHATGFVHGDLKPDNILVGPDGDMWVADFGESRRVAVPPAPRRPRHLTEFQPADSSWTPAVDHFALGVLLHTLFFECSFAVHRYGEGGRRRRRAHVPRGVAQEARHIVDTLTHRRYERRKAGLPALADLIRGLRADGTSVC
jgi:serine/threonine protein kinase